MKRWMLIALFAISLTGVTALASQSRVYLMCNHIAHDEGRYVRVGGPYDRISQCDPERIAHRANHGTGGKPFSVQCSIRSTAP